MVDYVKKDRIAFITFNRPEAKNAIDPPTHKRLWEIWEDFESDYRQEAKIRRDSVLSQIPENERIEKEQEMKNQTSRELAQMSENFYDKNEFIDTYDRFIEKLDTYKPREYVLDNLSVEVCSERFKELINKL